MRIKLYPDNNDPKQIQRIVSALQDGEIIIIPTDTTYVLACNALKERAVERICQLKQINPARHPLTIICYDISAISEYTRITTPTYKLIKRNLPGLFTFILPGLSKLPKIFRSQKNHEVGIRMPQHAITQEVLRNLAEPLMTTSIPREEDEEEYLTDPELIDEKWATRVSLVVDGGKIQLKQSTIVDCTDEDPTIVRQGDGILKL